MDNHYCQSCTKPLTPAEISSRGVYCEYCADEKGQLNPKEQVKAGLIHWFREWMPAADDATMSQRADHFLSAMPAWDKN